MASDPSTKHFDDDKVGLLLRAIELGDKPSTSALLNQCLPRLTTFFKTWNGSRDRHDAEDDDDLAQSVLTDLWRRIGAGKFNDVHFAPDFWCILLIAAKRKALSHDRSRHRKKRGGATTNGSIDSSADVPGRAAPVANFEIEEEFVRLLGLLQDREQQLIASLIFEGHTTQQIADLVNRSSSTIERRLKTIRRIWLTNLA
jgi:RNA polymerase sigma factor (sigma-70 family)